MDEPFRGSRGKGIQPRTQEVFEDLRILGRIVAVGGEYPPLRTYRQGGGHHKAPAMEPSGPTPAEPHARALMVPQFLTEGVMRERLLELGARAEFGAELVAFEQDEEGVTARLVGRAGERVWRVRYLVGADGGRSFVRHALGVGFPGKTLGVRAVVADLALTGLARDAWHRYGEGDMARQIALCPLAGTDLFQLQAPIPLEGDVDLSAEGLSKMVAERTGQADIALAGARAPDAPIRGRAGLPTRLFELYEGPHWTLFGYDVDRGLVPPRAGLHIHTFGPGGDVVDVAGHVRREYGLAPRDWVLVRPDGYVGAIVGSDRLDALERYLESVGLASHSEAS